MRKQELLKSLTRRVEIACGFRQSCQHVVHLTEKEHKRERQKPSKGSHQMKIKLTRSSNVTYFCVGIFLSWHPGCYSLAPRQSPWWEGQVNHNFLFTLIDGTLSWWRICTQRVQKYLLPQLVCRPSMHSGKTSRKKANKADCLRMASDSFRLLLTMLWPFTAMMMSPYRMRFFSSAEPFEPFGNWR
jgi:hypothetical protein